MEHFIKFVILLVSTWVYLLSTGFFLIAYAGTNFYNMFFGLAIWFVISIGWIASLLEYEED